MARIVATSPKGKLDSVDGGEIVKTAIVVVVSALFTYFGTEVLSKFEGSQEMWVAIGCVVFTALWKWWQDNQDDIVKKESK